MNTKYHVNVFNNGTGECLSDYVVRFKADDKKTFRIGVEQMFLITPNQSICSQCGSVKITMLKLNSVEMDDG